MKYCTKCGTELPDGVKFCPKCGAPVQASRSENGSGQQQWTNGTASSDSFHKNVETPQFQTISNEKTNRIINEKTNRIITLICAALSFLGCFLPWAGVSVSGSISLFGVGISQDGAWSINGLDAHTGIIILIMMAVVIAMNVYSIDQHIYKKKTTIVSMIFFIINILFAIAMIRDAESEPLVTIKAGIDLIIVASVIGIINEVVLTVKRGK